MTTSSAFIQQATSQATPDNNLGLKTVVVSDSFPTTGAIGNGWTDLAGGIWTVSSAGTLTGTTSDEAGFLSKFCLRPVAENSLNQEVFVDLTAGLLNQASFGVVLRHQPTSNNHYLAKLNQSGTLEVFKIVGGSVINIHFGTNYSVNGFVYNNAQKYGIQFACFGSNSTTIRIKIYNRTTGQTVLELVAQDNEPSLQIAGRSGVSVWSNGNNSASTTNITTSNLGSNASFINAIFYGDSITQGEGTTLTQYYNTLNGFVYPAIVAREMGQHFTGNNLGVGGRRLDTMITAAATDLPANFKADYKNVFVVLGGANDIIQSNGSTSQLYTRIKTLCLLARTNGYKVVVCTILPASQFSADRFNYIRNEVNTLVRANFQDFADGLCDLASDLTIGLDGAENNSRYYLGDKIHPTDFGYKIIGGLVARTIKAILNPNKIIIDSTNKDNPTENGLAIIDYGNNMLQQTDLTVAVSNPQVMATTRVQLGSILAGSGRDPDEMEMETLIANLGAVYAGGFDIYVKNPTCGASGTYNIQYTIN